MQQQDVRQREESGVDDVTPLGAQLTAAILFFGEDVSVHETGFQ